MLLFIVLVAFIALSAGLAYFFIKDDKGEKEPIGALWLAFGAGVLGAVAASFLEKFFLKDLSNGVNSNGMLFVLFMGVGLIEEACKYLPLSLFIYGKRYFNEHTDGLIYFSLAGLGFGLPENLLYTLGGGAKTGAVRLILTPFFHAATTSMVGYFLIKGKLNHQSRARSWAMLGVAMLLHGMYDFGLSTTIPGLYILSFAITIGMTATMFILYGKATRLDQQMGLSVVGNNAFCRSCGFPNPQRSLYCARCGKHA